MKRLFEHDTVKTLLIPIILSCSWGTLLSPDACLSQADANQPITIAHQPITIARQGQPLSITAHIGGDKGIRNVILKIDYDGKSVRGAMPLKKGSGVVPVIVQIITGDLDIFAGPGALYKKLGTAKRGARLLVTSNKDGYYRVITAGNTLGYIDAERTAVIRTGNAYGVRVPPEMTQGTLSYQIIAQDSTGQTAQSGLIQVTLLNEDEIAAIRSKPKITAKAEAIEPK